MERLTKKNPETNLERLLNFAIAKDKQVILDYGFEKKPLVQLVAEKAEGMGCDVSEQAVMWEGQCMECDCAVALMNMLAVQAAELHARLSKIEDILGNEYDLDRLRELADADRDRERWLEAAKNGIEKAAMRYALETDGWEFRKLLKENQINVKRLVKLVEADREGRCVVLPCKIGDTVYILTRTGVTEREIVQIEMMHDIEFYAVDYVRGETSVFFFPNDIGQTVFLTREEAQAKLKERGAK